MTATFTVYISLLYERPAYRQFGEGRLSAEAAVRAWARAAHVRNAARAWVVCDQDDYTTLDWNRESGLTFPKEGRDFDFFQDCVPSGTNAN